MKEQSVKQETTADFRAAWAVLNAKPPRTEYDFEREAALMEHALIDATLRRMERRANLALDDLARVQRRARTNEQLKRWATHAVRRPKGMSQ